MAYFFVTIPYEIGIINMLCALIQSCLVIFNDSKKCVIKSHQICEMHFRVELSTKIAEMLKLESGLGMIRHENSALKC